MILELELVFSMTPENKFWGGRQNFGQGEASEATKSSGGTVPNTTLISTSKLIRSIQDSTS